MDPDDGNATGGRYLSTAGQHLSASARSVDGTERMQNGALCRRLRDLMRNGGRGRSGVVPGYGVDAGERSDAASAEDADRRCTTTRPGIRLPGLSVRERS